MNTPVDCLVIGAGFGGLGAALTACELGARVVLCESLRYPGGCASTFTRRGWRFEAGATLFSGFGEGQLFERWIRKHGMDVRSTSLDPSVHLRSEGWSLEIPPEREAMIARMCALPGAPVAALRRFFAFQREIADALWSLFDDPDLLPPLDLGAVVRHCLRAPRYLSLLSALGRPLSALLERFEVDGFEPLRTYVDALCQITVQTNAREVEAPFALASMDYCFRGTRHIHGGIGSLAWAMVRAVEALGGEVRMADAVRSLRRDGDHWVATTRRGELRARRVIANLLPQSLQALCPDQRSRDLEVLSGEVERSWGAVMLYLGLAEGAPIRREAYHLQLVGDPGKELVHGNHLFASVSAEDERDRGPGGARTVTVSTHVSMRELLALGSEAQGRRVQEIQDEMRALLRRRAPEVAGHVVFEMPASPRTFERFTGRYRGYVGGIPRIAGMASYRTLGPVEAMPGLFLVGDSVFPGQSTLATALGGQRVATRALRR